MADQNTCFGHSNTTVYDSESLVGLVWYKPDEQLWLTIELALVRKALEPYLVQRLYKFPIANTDTISLDLITTSTSHLNPYI